MIPNECYEQYLGLLAFTGRNKQRISDGIREKSWKKLHVWKSELFSIERREVLIKAVVQAIPSYTLSIFRLPAGLCHRLRSMIMQFWWGTATGDEKRIHWRKWILLCQPVQGGICFRDFICFNQALIAKQVWRLLNDPNSLVAQIYKQKYFPSSNLLQAKCGNNPSYAWRSLLWGRDLLIKGLRWRIGSGKSVKVFHDAWLLRP